MKFLSPDSRFMQGWNDLTDAIWINILMLVTSLPVVTAGAALCAGSTALRKSQRGQGTVTRNYFAAFRENLAKATLLWLIFGICGAAITYSWIALQITPLLIPKFALTIIWAIGFEWAFYLQARFENPLARPCATPTCSASSTSPRRSPAWRSTSCSWVCSSPHGSTCRRGSSCSLCLATAACSHCTPILEYALRRYTRQ